MRFSVQLIDPFGTVTGRGEIETDNSVLDIGYGVITGRKGKTMTAVSQQLTEAERAEQIRQMCDRPYEQPLEIDARAVPGWRIVMEAVS